MVSSISRAKRATAWRIFLTSYQLFSDKPSRFIFSIGESEAHAAMAIEIEERTHGISDSHFEPSPEGSKKVVQHSIYERNHKNRARALEIHGLLCAACGFKFNDFYGRELANGFIEVHHVRSITKQHGKPINPATDLIPLCSNCHSMAHRYPDRILTVEELRAAIETAQIRKATPQTQ